MIKPGLVSISFRQLSVERVIELAKEAGLAGIEWGGGIHVPHGDVDRAKEVGELTRSAELSCAAYGSYYHVVQSEEAGLTFDAVLESANALYTSIIRVWAGGKNSADADEAYWDKVVSESQRIADLAGAEGIKIVYEFHDDTLTNTYESCKKLLEMVGHPNVFTYWQPKHGYGAERNIAGMDLIMPWVVGAHIFHWWPTHETRHLLSVGVDDWKQYIAKLGELSCDIFGLMEFVKGDLEENFVADAVMLKDLL